MKYAVYILYSEVSDRFYIGQTSNVESRLERHNKGYEKATSPYIPWVLKCVIEKESRSEAMILERKIKNMNRDKLLVFIENNG
jgi:putative endonuclease